MPSRFTFSLVVLLTWLGYDLGAVNIDSLQLVISKRTTDSNHVKVVVALAGEVYYENPDSAIAMLTAVLRVSNVLLMDD